MLILALGKAFEELVRSFDPKHLLELLARAANWLAHEGVAFCNQHEVQRALDQYRRKSDFV